jgi:hypothetical protein
MHANEAGRVQNSSAALGLASDANFAQFVSYFGIENEKWSNNRCRN